MKTRKLSVIFAAACAGVLLVAAQPAAASTTELQATSAEVQQLLEGAPADAPAYDPSVPLPGPGDYTWEEMSEIPEGAVTFTAEQGASGSQARAALAEACTINTGNVYKRASGGIYPNGAAGAKPRVTCTNVMVRLSISSELTKKVWWGWQGQAGPVYDSQTGIGTLQQKTLEKRCDDLRETTFRVVSSSTGTFPTGNTGSASAFEEATLRCGTN